MLAEKPSTSAKFILKSLPKSISRTNDHDVPLPSPFPLPANYRADMAAAFEIGHMTTDTESAFFSSIASAFFKFKKCQPLKTTLMWLLALLRNIHF